MSLGILEAVVEEAADALLRADVGRDADIAAGGMPSFSCLLLASEAEEGLRRGIFDGDVDPDLEEVAVVCGVDV